jgi:NAD(P)-dependent dehydrogenase (short-subunit alcohol dehydrogenase family)
MKKTALVTGGAGGIGSAACRLLAKEGWRVIKN